MMISLYNPVVKAEGKVEGIQESIFDIQEELGSISLALREKIISQKDRNVLSKWLKLSATADSIEEFEGKINYS